MFGLGIANLFENITKLITTQKEEKIIIDMPGSLGNNIINKNNSGSKIAADRMFNFCKIKGNAFIQKQIEHRNGRVFMRSKKRNLILIKHRGDSRVVVNNVKFDGMYHI